MVARPSGAPNTSYRSPVAGTATTCWLPSRADAAENATSAASSDFSPRVSRAVAAKETSELAATV